MDLTRFIEHPATFQALNPRGDETQVWASANGAALVFKVFEIRRVKQRWRARWKQPCPVHGHRHGWSERINAERFCALGLPGLAVRAFLEKRNALLCRQQVVAYPYLRGFRTLHERLSQQPIVALDAVEPVIVQMALAGVFHLDLNTRNVMLDDDDNVRIIDFEYMAWDQSRKGELYAYYLGYLWQKWAQHCLAENTFDQWATRHLGRRAALFNVATNTCQAHYSLGKQMELSRAKRYELFS
ncbi:hypothetical protein PMM47T1_16023 [Pseudomonas sp. M47T1]|nr:hypothetical protein PMM47T1_16023 [Pseudomonas sp. M47T1]